MTKTRYELLECAACGHQFVRPAEGKGALPCKCGGRRWRVFELYHDEQPRQLLTPTWEEAA